MEQSTSEELYNAYIRLVELSQGGNVELWNRREIPAKRMQDAGWTDVPDGSYATVYSSTFSNDNETQFMNFTPIMNNGEVLTPNEFFNYCFGVVNNEIQDSLKLKIGATYSSLQDATDAAIESHEVSEVFYELRDSPKEEISALDFVLLKERVKGECSRRKYNGSVASYASSSYDYTVTPTTGKVPLPEHFNKIIVPMNAIINTGRTQTKSGFLVRQIYELGEAMTTLESIEFTAASSGCKASCTGLCQGTCTTGCTGCTGSCSGSCGSGCSTGCWNICYADCATGCYSSCDRTCAPTCSQNCYNTCSGTCSGGCSSLCKGTCVGGNNVSPN